MRALSETLFAHEDDEAGIPSARLDAFVADVDHMLGHASITLRVGLLAMFDLMRVLPFFYLFKLATFEDLALRDRTRLLAKMEASRLAPISLAFAAFKTLLTLVFFEDEGELRAAGYPGAARERYKRFLPAAPVASASQEAAP